MIFSPECKVYTIYKDITAISRNVLKKHAVLIQLLYLVEDLLNYRSKSKALSKFEIGNSVDFREKVRIKSKNLEVRN